MSTVPFPERIRRLQVLNAARDAVVHAARDWRKPEKGEVMDRVTDKLMAAVDALNALEKMERGE